MRDKLLDMVNVKFDDNTELLDALNTDIDTIIEEKLNELTDEELLDLLA